MPDTRVHRGPHPEDAALFAAAEWPKLRRAAGEMNWLLDRDYAPKSTLALVGDRHGLTQRQRLALSRATCPMAERDARQARLQSTGRLRGAPLWIDGYNLLITIEAALGGGVILIGRDGCCRDLASLHGTYRTVEETRPALDLIGESLADFGVSEAHWLLDRPVSNSGRLKTLLLETAASHGWTWSADLEFSPDAVLARTAGLVVTSDSAVLDRCGAWVNLARAIIEAKIPTARSIDLRVDP